MISDDKKINYNILMTQDFDKAVRQVAIIENVNKSVLIRSMCYEWLNRHYTSLIHDDIRG
jgi:hypothetical protein